MQQLPLLDSLLSDLQVKLNQALASLCQHEAHLTLKQAGLTTIDELHQDTQMFSTQLTTVYIPITGDVIGDIFTNFSSLSSFKMADALLGNQPGTTQLLGDIEASALKEFGNITTGVIVTELANKLKMSMMLTTPNLATDSFGALVDQVLASYAQTSNDLLTLEIPFRIDHLEIDGSFLLLFDRPSSDEITSRLQAIAPVEGAQ